MRGSFVQPRAEVDKGRVALRVAGAFALGVFNPLLTLIPLVDAGLGKDSNCGQLVRNVSPSVATGGALPASTDRR